MNIKTTEIKLNSTDMTISHHFTKEGKAEVEVIKNFMMITKHKNTQWYLSRPLKKGLTEKLDWMVTYYSLTVYVGGEEITSYHTGLKENLKHFITAVVREFPIVNKNVFDNTEENLRYYE